MLTIRFNRVGKKNRAAFRIALQEKAKAPGRKHVEMLGSYDPHSKVAVLKKERILHWISMGAETSESVHNLLVKEGMVEGKKRAIKMEKPAIKEQEAVNKEQGTAVSTGASVAEEPVKAEEIPKTEVIVETPIIAGEAAKVDAAPVVEEAKKAKKAEEVKA